VGWKPRCRKINAVLTKGQDMTAQNDGRRRSRRNAAKPLTGQRVVRTVREQQYFHLVRLAWNLNRRGLRTAVELPLKTEPVLVVPREPGALRIMAFSQGGTWVYTWRRGRDHQVRVLADDAADRIWEVAQ
jgi:hypothetical protein